MLSTFKHHYPNFSSSFRCSKPPIMEQSNKDHDEEEPIQIEKEDMFDKVVTPSDVGKLNRLVIPKQHAERYFPLHSSETEKGLLLNFEDRNGKSWGFRYSYWNSSQSYVITKGWSRFVKEKRLNAGDIVSFQRGVGESNKHRLFIDWKSRRPRSDHRLIIPNSRQQHPFVPMTNYNHGLGSVSSWAHPSLPRVSSGSMINSMFYGGCSMMKKPMMIFESVPVMHGKKKKKKAESKRLRLFGVNMECPNTESDESIATPYLHHPGNMILSTEVLNKGKSSSSLSFDFGC